MKERKETINIVTANIVSIGILLISAIVLYGIFFMVYDSGDWFNAETKDSMVNNFGTTYLKFMIVLVVGIIVHELIHGPGQTHLMNLDSSGYLPIQTSQRHP